MLTIEQSLKLKREIFEQEKKFNELLEKKDQEIKQLEEELKQVFDISVVDDKEAERINLTDDASEMSQIDQIYNNLLERGKINNFLEVNKLIEKGDVFSRSNKIVMLFKDLDLVEEKTGGIFSNTTIKIKLSSTGKSLLQKIRLVFNEKDMKDESNIEIFYEKIKNKKLIENYLEICKEINQGKEIKIDIVGLDEFISLGLLKFNKFVSSNEWGVYDITEMGESVLNKIRLEI